MLKNVQPGCRLSSLAFTRMTCTGETIAVRVLTLFRMIAASGAAIAGAFRMVTGTGGRSDVVLRPGDRAPEFALPGSDGRVYRLSEMIGAGHTVVVAWFPKAFTIG